MSQAVVPREAAAVLTGAVGRLLPGCGCEPPPCSVYGS